MTEKRSVYDLAILGGDRAFAEPLHVGRPNIVKREELHRRLDEILDRNWLTNDGPVLREFESRAAEFLGVPNCVAVCNATTGLQLLARAFNLTGEVIMPAFTFVATAHAFKWLGLEPVFADINRDTHTIDIESVERLINPNTSAIVGVHTWGNGCDTGELEPIATDNKLALIYDASHAFGCSIEGCLVGSFGDAEVFSFHATKVVNSFEGGLITTRNDALAGELRKIRNFGFSGFDKVDSLGINGKMNEFSAAVAITGLESFGDIVAINRRNYKAYERRLANVRGVTLRQVRTKESHNYHYVVVEIDEKNYGDRDTLVSVLHAENVLARRYFYPGCHMWAPYASSTAVHVDLPITDEVARNVVVLPTGSGVIEQDIETICHIISLVIENSRLVQTKLIEDSDQTNAHVEQA